MRTARGPLARAWRHGYGSRMTDSTHVALLVTGASGHLGRRVLDLLLESGVRNLAATTRTPRSLEDLASRGVQVREADFGRPDTLPAAFAGVDRMLLVSTDVIDTAGTRAARPRRLSRAPLFAGHHHLDLLGDSR